MGKTIGIKLRYDNFKTATRDQTVDTYTADAKVIRQAAGLCLKRVPLERRLRLLGVRIGSLAPVKTSHSDTIFAASRLAENIEPGLF